MRQILCAPCGAGKTICAAHLVEATQRKGPGGIIFLADRVSLIRQTSDEFRKFGIEHGVVQGEYTHGRTLPTQVCSMQSLEKRGFLPGSSIRLVVYDEAHGIRKQMVKLLLSMNVPLIGLTATPFTKGLGKIYDGCVDLITTDQLVAEGWLSPLRVIAGAEPDMAGAPTGKRGEWTGGAIEQRGRVIIGDILATWKEQTQRFFGGPVKTIVFSATVAHGREICEAFQEAGYDFRQVSYLDKDEEDAERKIEMYRQGKIMGLISVDKLSRGFDVPDTMCMIAARPYKEAFGAHIQQMGRVMRCAPGKEFGLLLCHSGNYLGFRDDMADFFRNGPGPLDMGKDKGKQRVRKKKPRKELVCPCGVVMDPGSNVCSVCGREMKRTNKVTVMDGEMVEVTGVTGGKGWADKAVGDYVWQQVCRLALERKGDAHSAKKTARGYFVNLTGAWPSKSRAFDPAPLSAMDRQIGKDVNKGLRKYWTTRKYARGGGKL